MDRLKPWCVPPSPRFGIHLHSNMDRLKPRTGVHTDYNIDDLHSNMDRLKRGVLNECRE